MISESKFLEIRNKYGEFASWAIWNTDNESDTKIFDQNIQKLHTNWVLIGLNISKPVRIWGNFRGGKHDRKIKYAFSNTSIFGAYMTDLIKKSEISANKILKGIETGDIDLSIQIITFVEELKCVGVNENTKFIIFGATARTVYDEYYAKYFPSNKVYYLKHYSGRGTDKDWVENIWNRLSFNLNFETEKLKYSHNTTQQGIDKSESEL